MVYLINMPLHFSDDRQIQSLGLAYLASDLINNGIGVKIIDGCGVHRDVTYDEVKKDILLNRPQYIGFYVIEFNITVTLKLIHELKQNYSFIAFLGGPQASLMGYNIICHNPDIDFITCGETDGKLPKILKGDYSVSGIIYRKENQITINDMNSDNFVLDELPYPTRSLNGVSLLTKNIVDNKEYFVVPISSSRGCPFQCTFCSVPALNKQHKTKWRFRSADNIIEEICNVYKEYNNIEVRFIDDNFFVDFDRALYIAKAISQLGDIPFSFSARVDAILKAEEALLHELKRCGLQAIEIGIENFNDNVLQRYKKGHTSDEATLAIRKLRDCHIQPGIDFIMFDPWTTMEELEHNICIIENEKLDTYLDAFLYNRLYPFPGTAIYGLIDMDQYFNNNEINKIYNKMMLFKKEYQMKLRSHILESKSMIAKITCLKAPYKLFSELIKKPDLPLSDSITIKMITNVMKI